MMNNLGTRFKNVRKHLKKSQEEMAQELDITKQAISNIENSKSSPSAIILYKLLNEYDVNLNYLIGGVGNIYINEEKAYTSIRSSLIKEVEDLLDSRGIK